MFSIKTVIASVVEQGRRALLQATTRARINPPGPVKRLKLSESHTHTGVGRPVPKGGNSNQHCETEAHGSTTLSSGGGIVNLLRPVTSRIVQGLLRRVSSPLWAEARKKSAKRLFGETAPYFALVGVTLVSGPERGLLTAQDELEAICGDIREAISRAGWIHNPNFWKAPTPESSCEDDSAAGKGFSLSDFDLGSAINKGCNAVVYATRWKNEDTKHDVSEPETPESIESKLASNPPKLVKSLKDIFNNGSLWSLEQIQSNSGAISKNGTSSTHTELSFSTDEEKTISPSSSPDSRSDISIEDLYFNANNYNAKAKLIANTTEEFLNLNEAYSLSSLDTIGAHSASAQLDMLDPRSRKISLSEDIDLLLSTGGFQRSREMNGQKRKKVKFKEEEKQEADQERSFRPRRGDMLQGIVEGPPSSVEEYPLAMKMMFNYEAESNAPAILAAMYKEMLPAKSVQLDDVSTLWKQRLLNTSTTLPPHVNIVDMPCVFVDRIPHLADGFNLYPEALPKRINPAGYGRNMSLFCVMKRYDCTVADYLREHTPGVRTSLLMLAQLLEAIHHINKYNITHRDMKSDNLLLCLKEGVDSPHLVLSDFGCCLTDPSFSVAFSSYETDPRAGNAALMAPEVKSCTPGLFTYINYSKADLWSVGALAYELFGLENPFAPRGNLNANEMRNGQRVLMLDSASYKESQLPRLPKTFPSEIRALVHDLLRRNPKQRPSPTVAATICQLSLWGPRKWLNRHALTMPSDNEVMRWLLCLSTKVLCEAGSSPGASWPPGSGTATGSGIEESKGGGQLEYEIVSSFLKRVHYSDVIQALKWIRAF